MAKTPSAAKVVQSYLARTPVKSKLHSVEAGDNLPGGWRIKKPGHAITGQLGHNKVQILAHPDRVIEDFANTANRPEDILRFTKRYGVLHRDDKEWLEICPGDELEGDGFFIHCSQWRERQERFREEWGRKAKPDDEIANAFADQINPKYQAGRAVKAFVRPGKSRGLQLELQPDDLLGALWLALLGVSGRTRKCQNATCSSPYFLASRRDQKFCTEACSRLVANRRWWADKGAQWRKNKLKGGRNSE